MKTLMPVCAALLVAAATTPTAAAAERSSCWNHTEQLEGWSGDHQPWIYRYTVKWCGDKGLIVSVDVPEVKLDAQDPNCRLLEAPGPQAGLPGGLEVETSSTDMVVGCPEDTAGASGMNPWMIITLHADGTHDVPEKDTRPPE